MLEDKYRQLREDKRWPKSTPSGEMDAEASYATSHAARGVRNTLEIMIDLLYTGVPIQNILSAIEGTSAPATK